MLPGVQDPQGWLWPGGPTPTRGIRTVRGAANSDQW